LRGGGGGGGGAQGGVTWVVESWRRDKRAQ
jgi:hypothetical protein